MLPGGSLINYSDGLAGEFSLGLSFENEQLDSPLYGTDPIPNYNKERTLNSSVTLIANYGITDYFWITGYLPYKNIVNEKVLFRGQNLNQYDGGKYFREAYGVGDIVIQTRIQPPNLKLFGLPMTFGVGIKLNTGKINAMDIYGERISDNLQVGTGTIDPVLSIYTSKEKGKLNYSGGIFTRISNGENIYGYKYGNEIQTIFNIDYLEPTFVYGGIQLSHLLTTRDHYEYGKIARDRGGQSLLFAAKIGTRVSDRFDIEMTIQKPIYYDLNEAQLTAPLGIQVGSLYKFLRDE